ncbi:hypothetical protein ZOSMA_1153G00010 [Zostera marina]|uniref:Pectate lyase superfamily protein domain-containing protein n=1 Tax=Zostera marina TaxID=29655 RepID=A0A0K9Q2A7_ZOSMR|nr:hypothetical protein ZOSMA_1153G00010 [Zostera marina]
MDDALNFQTQGFEHRHSKKGIWGVSIGSLIRITVMVGVIICTADPGKAATHFHKRNHRASASRSTLVDHQLSQLLSTNSYYNKSTSPGSAAVFNVMEMGAVGDGRTNDTQAFKDT